MSPKWKIHRIEVGWTWGLYLGKCLQTYVDKNFKTCFDAGNSFLKFVEVFQIHTVYWSNALILTTPTYSFSTTDYLMVLHHILVEPKQEHVSRVWNTIKMIQTTDANKLQRIQWKFAALSFGLISCIHNSFTYVLELLNFYTLQDRRRHLATRFLYPCSRRIEILPFFVWWQMQQSSNL